MSQNIGHLAIHVNTQNSTHSSVHYSCGTGKFEFLHLLVVDIPSLSVDLGLHNCLSFDYLLKLV